MIFVQSVCEKSLLRLQDTLNVEMHEGSVICGGVNHLQCVGQCPGGMQPCMSWDSATKE